MTQDDADELALRELELLLFHEVTPSEVACFLVEPMQGEGGYYPASPRFLATLRELADEHGILLIADEVQTGFGRTGDWFATQVLDVEPDVLVMGKAIANGFPISAVGASKERFAQWPPGSHGTTFGGNPIAAAACAATVDGLAEIIEDVPKLADHAFTRLGDLQESHRTVGDVRGLGLMIGVELVGEDRTPAPEAFAAIRRHGLERGLIILDCGPHGNVVRFIPPLTVSLEQIDTAIEILDEALSSYEA